MGKVLTLLKAQLTGAPDHIFINRPRLCSLRSDKNSQFTEALAKNESEQESLTGLLANKVMITRVSILSKRALCFRLSFFSRAASTNVDLDSDTFVGIVEANLDKYKEWT